MEVLIWIKCTQIRIAGRRRAKAIRVRHRSWQRVEHYDDDLI